ncbi:hypothetical protein [Streptomyces sp. NPDC013187]|uniref:hypothetical protein n=1 Tax=Streptomyces sp. NPDC013187 TaxID=3364865 RepID=UPI0036A2D107
MIRPQHRIPPVRGARKRNGYPDDSHIAIDWTFERGHHEISLAVAEQGVLPAVHAAAPGSLLLPDGFSCRTQIEQPPGP